MPQLKHLSVNYISLVRAPATGKALTLKTGDRANMVRIAKTDDERMIAYGIVYAPDEVDAHGDTATAATIRRAAYEFVREGRAKNVDREHSFAPEMAYVAESWLVRSGDPLFESEPEGAWAVGIQIGDADVWAELKSGALAGISLAGIASIEPTTPPPPATLWTEKDEAGFVAWLKSLFTPEKHEKNNEKDETMDETKVQEIVRSAIKDEMLPAIAQALKAAGITPAEDQPTTQTPPTANDEVTALKSAVAALEDRVAVALAKGQTRVDGGASAQEGFL